MPLYTDTLRDNDARRGLTINPRVAEFWRIAHHFVDTASGPKLDNDLPWGLLLRGYGDIGLPGFEGQLQYSDTVDNRLGLAKPTEVSRQPSGRDIQLHYLVGNPAHRFLGNTVLNQRIAFRHVGPPPQMDLTHSVDIITRGVGATVNQETGRVDTLNAVPVAIPVTIGGLYYQAPQYVTNTTTGGSAILGTNGVSFAATSTERVLDGDNSIGTLTSVGVAIEGVTITSGEPVAGSTAKFDIGGTVGADLPENYTRRAMIVAPGVGYSLSNAYTSSSAEAAKAFNTITFPNDQDLIQAIVDETPELWLAIWQFPSARQALDR